MIINLIVAALLIEQSINITMNITTNERLNRSRYPWMNDSLGNPYNHYDKGCIRNILEFWRFPGFEKDYYSEFNWLTLRDTMMSSAEKAEAIIENKRKESEKAFITYKNKKKRYISSNSNIPDKYRSKYRCCC